MPEAITATTLLRRSPDAVDGELPEETVLLHMARGEALKINSTANWIWTQIAEPAAVGEIAERLALEYGIELEQATGDVTTFAEELSSREFIELG